MAQEISIPSEASSSSSSSLHPYFWDPPVACFSSKMGCAYSTLKRDTNTRRKKGSVMEVAVFAPALRVPVHVDLIRLLKGVVPQDVLHRLSQLRGRIVSLAEGNVVATVHDVMELERALQEYLPAILGLTRKEYCLEKPVEFKWKSSGHDGKVTSLASVWYELLSVVHMMAMLFLLQANLILFPKASSDDGERVVSEGLKKDAFDLLLKASACLGYCVHHILVYLPPHIRNDLPKELQEGVLEAISNEALGQGVQFQLGLAHECEKVTLSVKRRLACEMVGYLSQAHNCLIRCDTRDEYGKKLLLFIRWKFLEAKASAYYFHYLFLSKGSGPSDHISAACCLFAAHELLVDSKKACLSFCLAAPVSRVPPAWGIMKHLHSKVPEIANKKSTTYGHLFGQDKVFQSLPDLPEFPLSLKPDECDLPNIDASWDREMNMIYQILMHHRTVRIASPSMPKMRMMRWKQTDDGLKSALRKFPLNFFKLKKSHLEKPHCSRRMDAL